MGKVLVSIGHHAEAQGARFGQLTEYAEASVWSALLARRLPTAVVPVPPGYLREKVAFINARADEADLVVELHFNAAVGDDGEPIGEGCEALYYPGSDRGAGYAAQLVEALAPLFPPLRGAKEGWYRGDPARGAHFFLQRTALPAVLLEPDFVHHAERIRAKRYAAVDALAMVLERITGGV